MKKSNYSITKEFNKVGPELMTHLGMPGLMNIKLTYDVNEADNHVKQTLFYNGKKKTLNNTNIKWDLFISIPDRKIINHKGEEFDLKPTPNRQSVLLMLLVNHYNRQLHLYDYNETTSKTVSDDAFRKLFSDLRIKVGEKVLPKGTRAFSPVAKIIIKKESSNA